MGSEPIREDKVELVLTREAVEELVGMLVAY